MSFIQQKEIVLDIGLNKQYTIVHFSDVHVITYSDNDTKQEIEKAIKQEQAWFRVRKDFANYFNELCEDKHMIASTLCLDNLIEYNNNVKPDITLLSGDIIDYYSVSNYNYLKKSLSNINNPYLFSCGNHETPSSLYDELCNGNGQFNQIEFEEFIIVSLDDSKKKINENQLELLNETLKKNKPIILTMHIPLLTKNNIEEMKKYDSYYVINYADTDQTTLKFLNTVVDNPLIKAIFCGHTHGAGLSYVSENKPQYCASSGLIGYVNLIKIK